MSTPAKTIILRAILPNDPPAKIALSREAPDKLESGTLTLSPLMMATGTIVSRIKELSKLRDEIIQAMRQITIPRESRSSTSDPLNYFGELDAIRQELDDARNQFQEFQNKIDSVQRRIDDSKKLISELEELSRTGFTSDQLELEVGDFRKVLGRVPVKKLEAMQKAIQAQLKDQAILATGTRGKDIAYILIATPKDKSSQALQTLLLYDLSQVDIPELGSNNPQVEIQAQDAKVSALTAELDELKRNEDTFRKTVGQVLNRRLDEVSDSLVLLRGTLKLGEGALAARVYARMEKPPTTATMDELTRKGVVELETLS